MSEQAFRPVRAVVRQMRVAHLTGFIWFWGIVISLWAIVATVIVLIGQADLSPWQWFSLSPSKYFIMAMGIHAAAVYLPLYIGHGITRRHFMAGSAIFFAGSSLAFGGIVLAGYLIELLMRTASEPTGPLGPVDSVGAALLVLARATIVHVAFVCTGWLIGGCFYRYGVWGGILLIPPCAIPGFGSDFVLRTDPNGAHLDDIVDLGAAIEPVGFGISLVLIAAGAQAVRILLRDVAVRKVTA
jgi:hypothetical protein